MVAMLLLIVIGLVVLTNMGERRNAVKINNAVTSMYEDRLIVEGYIFELSQQLGYLERVTEEKTVPENTRSITAILSSVSTISGLYLKTQLTQEEETNFERFRLICTEISRHAGKRDFTKIRPLITDANDVLKKLSLIQLNEARLKMDDVTSLSSFSTIISHCEFAILILIAIVAQALIFSSPIIRFTGGEKASLN